MKEESDSLKWAEWMRKAQEGDSVLYQRLLMEIRGYLYNVIRLKIKDPVISEDLLQESLLSVHKYRHTFDPTHNMKPWLNAILKSRISDYWRKQSKILENEKEVESEEASNWVAEQELSRIDMERLKIAMDQLPVKQREIINLMKIEGCSIKEVARQMNMSESAVKVSAHRGYKKLKEMIYEG